MIWVRLHKCPSSQRKRQVELYRGFVGLASMTAERLTDVERADMINAVIHLDDKKRTLRPQSFRDKSLMLWEVAEICRKIIEKHKTLTSDTQIREIIDGYIRRRWAIWQLKVGNKNGKVIDEAGVFHLLDKQTKYINIIDHPDKRVIHVFSPSGSSPVHHHPGEAGDRCHSGEDTWCHVHDDQEGRQRAAAVGVLLGLQVLVAGRVRQDPQQLEGEAHQHGGR